MQAGSYSAAALMSWPAARNVLVPAAEAVTAGETDGAAAGEAGTADDPAELAGAAALLARLEAGAAAELAAELQAVSSTAVPASSAAAAIGLPLRAFVVTINSPPVNFLRDSASRRTYTTPDAPPWLEAA